MTIERPCATFQGMQIRRRACFLLLAALALDLDQGDHNEGDLDDSVDSVLDRVTEARASIETLQAPFSQKRRVGLLATEVKSKGKLTLVMPDRLRWDVLSPDEITFWIGPDGLVMKSDEGITRIGKGSAKRFAAVLGDLLVLIGGDIRTLKGRYTITAAGDKLALIPKDKRLAKHIKKVTLILDDASMVSIVSIHEKNGDASTITFGDYKKNAKVDPKYINPP